MNYVADTHSLVWYFLSDPRLGLTAGQIFDSTDNNTIIIIPAVVLAEMMYITKKGRVVLAFKDTLEKIEERPNFDIAPLDTNIIKIADAIEINLEMHDKLILSTALFYEAALITKDSEIEKSGLVKIVW
jgi:PIN domain nuclease of toxin-antitoxin system